MSFTSDLISWYEENKRELPFRGTKDPYLIWVSEVILQQTRMEQGLGYYKRFVERFPDIRSLASGSEEEVLKVWQGLGYYSRARNLHASAREIVERWGGEFPGTFARIRELKGIGDYSAASIASLAFNEPEAAVD
ncbi:MAG: A/G-specific adenine glycosylase, partial [Bacteroidota bacterium]